MHFTYYFGLLIPKCHEMKTGIGLFIKKTSEAGGYIKQNFLITALLCGVVVWRQAYNTTH